MFFVIYHFQAARATQARGQGAGCRGKAAGNRESLMNTKSLLAETKTRLAVLAEGKKKEHANRLELCKQLPGRMVHAEGSLQDLSSQLALLHPDLDREDHHHDDLVYHREGADRR